MFRVLCFSFLFFVGPSVWAQDYALTGLNAIKDLGFTAIYQRTDLGLGLVKISEQQKSELSHYMHKQGKCGGYEAIQLHDLKSMTAPFSAKDQRDIEKLFAHFPDPHQVFVKGNPDDLPQFSQETADLVKKVSSQRLFEDVSWISSYPTRHHTSEYKNTHVTELKKRLEQMVGKSSHIKIDLIDHQRTSQKTVRAIIEGSTRPNEIIVLGAHFDSINQSFFDKSAPGADDDASGSANLIETLRILLTAPRPERSIHFFWYAAEEVGLVGSGEIAANYKASQKDVVSVLQLDMTLYPGSGVKTMGFMTDFTSPWLRQYLTELNRLYIQAKIIEDQCGYGCSDHASWHRQGFATAMPFESTFDGMNRSIHTKDDHISDRYDFEHSAAFSQLAVAYVQSLGNSTHRQ